MKYVKGGRKNKTKDTKLKEEDKDKRIKEDKNKKEAIGEWMIIYLLHSIR